MKRRIMIGLTGTSIFLLVAFVVLWARSYWRADAVGIQTKNAYTNLISNQGFLSVYHHQLGGYFSANQLGWAFGAQPAFNYVSSYGDPGTRWQPHLFGFSLKVVDGGSIVTSARGVTPVTGTFWNSYWEIRVPYWFTVLALLLASIALVRSAMHRVIPGHCPKCGYDLRASPDRCPECGQANCI